MGVHEVQVDDRLSVLLAGEAAGAHGIIIESTSRVGMCVMRNCTLHSSISIETNKSTTMLCFLQWLKGGCLEDSECGK